MTIQPKLSTETIIYNSAKKPNDATSKKISVPLYAVPIKNSTKQQSRLLSNGYLVQNNNSHPQLYETVPPKYNYIKSFPPLPKIPNHK